ncbi:MAG: rRNA maturation RNase YbeY [Verrucomicrobiota bacterium]
MEVEVIISQGVEVGYEVARLSADLEEALGLVLQHAPGGKNILQELGSISVAIVSDEEMADLHLQFMGIEGPTDVITFHHGEIVISQDTAWRVGQEEGTSTYQETLLYGIHGLFHLYGYEDLEEPARQEMHRRQEAVLEQVSKSRDTSWKS